MTLMRSPFASDESGFADPAEALHYQAAIAYGEIDGRASQRMKAMRERRSGQDEIARRNVALAFAMGLSAKAGDPHGPNCRPFAQRYSVAGASSAR